MSNRQLVTAAQNQLPDPDEDGDRVIDQSRGRPTSLESLRRKARFLELAATGVPYDEAAAQAGVKPARALRIVSEPGFAELVNQMKTIPVAA